MRILLTSALLLCSGCASVEFRQLDSKLNLRPGAPTGHVYYLPKPYLFVARLPVSGLGGDAFSQANIKPLNGAGANARAGGGGGAGNVDQDNVDQDSAELPDSYGGAGGAATAEDKPKAAEGPKIEVGASDVSFGAASGEYIIKLVYLPDFSRPMSLSVRAGLFGVAQLKPTLVNGWMLTSFDANADNTKFADVLTAIPGVLSALKGGSGSSGDASGGGGDGTAAAATSGEVLRPGLYDFRYDPNNGHLQTLCALVFFGEKGTSRGNC